MVKWVPTVQTERSGYEEIVAVNLKRLIDLSIGDIANDVASEVDFLDVNAVNNDEMPVGQWFDRLGVALAVPDNIALKINGQRLRRGGETEQFHARAKG